MIRAGMRRRPEQLGQFIAPKSKVCQACRMKFIPDLPGAVVCSELCALIFAVSENGKARKVAAVKERKAKAVDQRETRAKLQKFKSLADWAKEAQKEFNTFIRLRDADLPCISCGRHHQGQYHAGHFLSVGARPELRFDESNVHKQCAPCNTYLSGNAVLYRKGLVDCIGLAGVESLEGPHPTRHYTVDELKAIKTDYAARTRALKKDQP